ncbi:MAG TPA: hypothetical protein VM686_30150 [Polyangiaceae bacterium]|nr:hypothetical protein [Polyangiaceae bacterium]
MSSLSFVDVTLDELRGLLDQADWQELFVAVSRCTEFAGNASDVVDAFLEHHRVTPRWIQRAVFNPERLPALDRSMAERYVAVLLQRELAYGTARLPREVALRGAALFLEPFGAGTVFYPSISLTAEVLTAKERDQPCGYGVYTGIFGSTLEEGIFAVDPGGCIGALFVGDED